ncbi:hypothetical protein DYU11_01340 [Fibrisoma montanum]|uniref:Uncharacterized protein n=2 Tax=Fibrisoma montanum TaxID=2305895 RepID=A0A418MKB9_9BACT|nr:hypothetical protein DYU11_01340 [Fibrisoma montanum]
MLSYEITNKNPLFLVVEIVPLSLPAMSTLPPNENRGPLDHLALRYLRQALNNPHPHDEPYVLSEAELRVIRHVRRQTLIIAALVGVLGVVLMYVPQYGWPELFVEIPLSFFGQSYALPITALLYGLILVYLEVSILLAVNLRATKLIMAACQFPRAHDARYDHHLKDIALASHRRRRTTRVVPRMGIDPYLNLPRWGLATFFLLNILKAVLSTQALRYAVSRLFSRVVQPVIDLIGLPIYAFWNAYASWQVVHEAQIRIMAPSTIREFVGELYDELGKNEQFRSMILDALQYIAVLKRQYNYAHFLLTETLLDRFNLRAGTPHPGEFTDRLKQAPPEVRRGLERLLVFGAVVDGRLSLLEKWRFRQLRKKGLLTHSRTAIGRVSADYNHGRGLWV